MLWPPSSGQLRPLSVGLPFQLVSLSWVSQSLGVTLGDCGGDSHAAMLSRLIAEGEGTGMEVTRGSPRPLPASSAQEPGLEDIPRAPQHPSPCLPASPEPASLRVPGALMDSSQSSPALCPQSHTPVSLGARHEFCPSVKTAGNIHPAATGGAGPHLGSSSPWAGRPQVTRHRARICLPIWMDMLVLQG